MTEIPAEIIEDARVMYSKGMTRIVSWGAIDRVQAWILSQAPDPRIEVVTYTFRMFDIGCNDIETRRERAKTILKALDAMGKP